MCVCVDRHSLRAVFLAWEQGQFVGWKVSRLIFNQTLNPEFVETIKALKNYTDQPDDWESAFQLFGTHVISHGSYGGQLKWFDQIDTSLYSSMSSQAIGTQVGISYQNYLSISGGRNGSTSQNDQNFIQASTNTSMFFGGQPGLFGPGQWNTWAPTVPSNPWLAQAVLEPIENYIPDTYLKTTWSLAVQYHQAKGATQYYQQVLASLVASANDAVTKANTLISQCTQYPASNSCPNCWKKDGGIFGHDKYYCQHFTGSCCSKLSPKLNSATVAAKAKTYIDQWTALLNTITGAAAQGVVSPTVAMGWATQVSAFETEWAAAALSTKYECMCYQAVQVGSCYGCPGTGYSAMLPSVLTM